MQERSYQRATRVFFQKARQAKLYAGILVFKRSGGGGRRMVWWWRGIFAGKTDDHHGMFFFRITSEAI